MDSLIRLVGVLVVGLGSGLLTLALIGLLGWFACVIWVEFSDRFRDICRGESLIFEYRRYHEEFLAWKAWKEGADND